MAQFRTLRKAGKKEALVVGIVGSVGSGKSTLVQVMKLILGSECCVGEANVPPRCESFARRFPHVAKGEGRTRIASRWELNSTAEYYATSVLQKLKTLSANDAVDIPCFCKGMRAVGHGAQCPRAVDIVLFEGWRIGVAAQLYPFNRVVDTLVFIEVNFDSILKMKYETVVRDIKIQKDMYEKYGGYKHVFAKHYRRMYYDWILPVKDSAT